MANPLPKHSSRAVRRASWIVSAAIAPAALSATVLAPSAGPGTENSAHVRLSDAALVSRISGTVEISGAGTNLVSVSFGRDADRNGRLDADETGLVLSRDRSGWKISVPGGGIVAETEAYGRTEFEIVCEGGRRDLVFKTPGDWFLLAYDPSWTFAKASVCGREGCVVSASAERRRFAVRIAAK